MDDDDPLARFQTEMRLLLLPPHRFSSASPAHALLQLLSAFLLPLTRLLSVELQ